MLHVVIMAGGKGERFWPKSRVRLPKQFLQLFGQGTLLQQTFRRATRLVQPENIYVVTGADYCDLVAEQLPEIPPQNIIVEPVGRDTAPCIGLTTLYLERLNPDGVMVVLPADQAILNEERFAEIVSTAVKVAAQDQHLVTLGIYPTRPETGYGYIQYGERHVSHGSVEVRKVRRFAEKPDVRTAEEFLIQGDYLWNSGMFAWKVSTIREMFRRYAPDLHNGLEQIRLALGTAKERRVLDEQFPLLPKISIDYAVMEKASDVLVLPSDFGWDDLGSWAALPRVREEDENGNLISGQAVAIDTHSCIIDGGERLIVTFGVEKLVIVDANDLIFVTEKSRVPELKRVIAELKDRGLEAYLLGKGAEEASAAAATDAIVTIGQQLPANVDTTSIAVPAHGSVRAVEKPWGRELWWAVTDQYVGKLIEVKAGHALSLQYHQMKRETMLFAKGTGQLVLGDRLIQIEPGLAVTIEPGTVHRVMAETDLVFFEASTAEVDDVVRLQDHYGRLTASRATSS